MFLVSQNYILLTNMGRFSSKFNSGEMSRTAKRLSFKMPVESETESERFERDFRSYRIQSDHTLIEEVDQLMADHPFKQAEKDEREKRQREWENVRQGMINGEKERLRMVYGKGKEKVTEKGETSIKLFGKDIKVEEKVNSGEKLDKSTVKRVYTLGELMKQEDVKEDDDQEIEVFKDLEDICSLGVLMSQERELAVRAKKAKAVEQPRQYTAVTRDSLSLNMAILEGEGDNFSGLTRSPLKAYTQLFKQYMRCCSPVRRERHIRDSPQSHMAMIAAESVQSSGTFSFMSPLDDSSYDAVEEWWPRTVCPSLQFSVTAIDPFMTRHPIWLERYGETSSAGEARMFGWLTGDEVMEGKASK